MHTQSIAPAHVCARCGTPYTPQRPNPSQQFCSTMCANRSRPLIPSAERFWAKVDTSGECWLWQGAKTRSSHGGIFYGRFWDGAKHGQVMAHRFSYELANGPITDGLTIDHLCRVTLCVRPDHLEAVTLRENILRSDGETARAARKTHCVNGHPFDEANTIHRGYRICRECVNANGRKYWARRAAEAGIELRRPIAMEKLQAIAADAAAGVPQRIVAQRHGVSKGMVWKAMKKVAAAPAPEADGE